MLGDLRTADRAKRREPAGKPAGSSSTDQARAALPRVAAARALASPNNTRKGKTISAPGKFQVPDLCQGPASISPPLPYRSTAAAGALGRCRPVMAIVSFTLSEEGVVAFQNALACMLKFGDDVSLEARRDRVRAPTHDP